MSNPRHAIENDPDFAARYALSESIGEGGFARVYRAVQRSTGQSVAVKVLDPRGQLDESLGEVHLARFRQEMTLCADLHHPNLVRLVDGGSAGDCVYTVFEFIPGRTLDRLLADEGALEPDEAAHLMGQVLDAIGYAHERGVVHRDLKPANIMVTEEGLRRNAMVLDFGIGTLLAEVREREIRKLTATHEAIGTPAYCAPEQLRGEESDGRSDLYSWGLILLECLSGEAPIQGRSLEALLEQQLGPLPVPVPEKVRALPLHGVLQQALAKDPAERAPSARALMGSLQAATTPLFARSGAEAGLASEGPLQLRQLTAVSLRVEWPGRFVDLEAEQACLHEFHQRARDTIQRHGGSPVAMIGSHVVALFGYPQAREQAARAALEAAVATRERVREMSEDAAVFTGVRSGALLEREGAVSAERWEPVSSAVLDGAAELEHRCHAGEIWACDDTRRLLRGRAVLEPVPAAEARELSRDAKRTAPLPAFRLAGEDGLRGLAAPTTPFIGRTAELEALKAAWSQVEGGRPQAVLVAGEAGIGKSRLIRELRQQVGEARWIHCRCTPESENSPLAPIVEWMRTLVRERPLAELIAGLGLGEPDLEPLMAELIGLPVTPDPGAAALPAKRKRDLTLEAVGTLIFAAARQRPLAFVIEDLHWADPTTREFLASLVQEIRSAAIFETEPQLPILTLLSARPEFEPPWSLADVPIVQLARLSAADSDALARALVDAGAAIPEAMIHDWIERAAGVPLFLEEMARMATEPAAGAEDEQRKRSQSIPATLRDLLSARIAKLPTAPRATAQRAACLGREFEFGLLAAVGDRDEASLRDDLDTLAREGLVFHRVGHGAGERFVFHHRLLSEAAIESMELQSRKQVNLRIAEALCAPEYDEIAANQPERLAVHFENAGVVDRALEFRHRAAFRAVGRSAHPEAIAHFEHALSLLGGLPEGRDRDVAELQLQLLRGTSYMASQGYAASTAEAAFERAMEICERYEEAPRLFSAVNGLWAYQLVRGDASLAPQLVARQREIAGRSNSERQLLFAHHAAGVTGFYSGRHEEALPDLIEATTRFEQFCESSPPRPGVPAWYRQAATSGSHLAWCLHLMGRTEEALERSDRCLELVEAMQDVDVHVEAMTYRVALLHDRREPEAAMTLLDRIVPLCEEHGLVFWLGVGKAARGWARAQLGERDGVLEEVEEGLALFFDSGAEVPRVYRACYLAETLLALGQARKGVEAIDRALERAQTRFDRFFDAEALRLRAELMLQDDPAAPQAEATLREALALADWQGARLLSLRAAMSLSRLLAARGEPAKAEALLAPILRNLDQGHALQDHREASALLADLGA